MLYKNGLTVLSDFSLEEADVRVSKGRIMDIVPRGTLHDPEEVRAIDQKSYDYLYSMQIMDNTGTNPIPNFTGGCLGYFSAYSHITYDCVYYDADVEEVE